MGGKRRIPKLHNSIVKPLLFVPLILILALFPGFNAVFSSTGNPTATNDCYPILDDEFFEPAAQLFDAVIDISSCDHLAGLDDGQEYVNELALSAERIGRVKLNESLLQPGGLSTGDILEFAVFDHLSYTVNLESVSWGSGAASLFGGAAGSDHGYLNMSVYEGVALAVLKLPAENRQYVLAHSESLSGYYLYEILLDSVEFLESATQVAPQVQEKLDDLSNGTGVLNQPDASATVDIMVIYTPSAAAWAGGGVENLINVAHNTALHTLQNSDIDLDLRKVHVQMADYTETGDMSLDLNRLTFDHGEEAAYFAEVHGLRDHYGADLVILFARDQNYTYGGMAWALMIPGGAPEFGFAIVDISRYADYAYIHEIGHLFGAGHHREQADRPGPQLFDYSAAWSWQGDDGKNYRSVMSYADLPGGFHQQVPHFSNPSVLHMGQPTGFDDLADNARTIRETKEIIASYRETTVFVTTPDTPSGPATGLVDSTYTFTTGGSFSPEGPDLEYRFDWGDGGYSAWSAGLGASHAWSAAGTYQVRAQARCAANTDLQSEWSGIKNVNIIEPVESGLLGSLEIGDRVVDYSWQWQFRTGDSYTYQEGDLTRPVVWTVVARDHYGEGSGVTLLSEELIGLHAFDNSFNRGGVQGSSHWGNSGIFNATCGLRAWLNSTGIHAGEGFYEAFSGSFKSGIITAAVPNRQWLQGDFYTTLDMVFIPSTTELGDDYSNAYEIGSVYPYFEHNTDRITQLAGTNRNYWTRSTVFSTYFGLYEVSSQGGFNL